ncbi:type III-B CRISPR module RAMP protein Cmr1 [Candidatus Solincola sp.]|nr:type III-B CRISPR module RAMP protein Cmr1 [Thermoanaerobacteraceae bacterium]MDI6874589.1 type III-B CRISPR module RAMP protein Cmr1 [Actinomycetota bacterium]
MGNNMEPKEWRLTALTDIWTGDAQGKPGRLIPTGLRGSIRWWFEVLVRGLGGKVCDPTVDGVRCPDKNVKNPYDPGHHCVVCELFGCTGWARKFRLMVLDQEGPVIQKQIKAGRTFTLHFIPLRSISDEEWCLLDATLRLIANYGALGGRTVFKPTDELNRQGEDYHRDFGLIRIKPVISGVRAYTGDELSRYVDYSHWRRVDHDDFAWASLDNFWCVKGRYLARQDPDNSTFNQIIGREQAKGRSQRLAQETPVNRWLAGRQQESKKVFSFKHPEEGRRTFGFVKPGLVEFDEMKRRLGQVWSPFNPDAEFITKDQILSELFSQGGNV